MGIRFLNKMSNLKERYEILEAKSWLTSMQRTLFEEDFLATEICSCYAPAKPNKNVESVSWLEMVIISGARIDV